MKEFIEKLIGRLEEASHWEESTFDEDGYCNDDSEEVIYLHKAIKIVNQLAEEYKDKAIINEQYCFQTCGATEHCKECNRLCNGSIDYYENYDFMAEEHNNGWIACSERLPEDQKEVLITLWNDTIEIGWFDMNDKQWFTEDFECDEGDVIAWQPLPPKYQPKGE